MFVTYLLRELRRRMRRAVFIAAGLAVGVGLVIMVTAASDGVSASQGAVLKSLYGVGTDVTVTQSPTASSGGTHVNFGGGPPGQQKSGTSFSRNILAGGGLGTIKSSSVRTVSGLTDVSAATGVLVINDVKLSGTVSPGSGGSSAGGAGGGAGGGSISSSSFTVTGIDPAHDSLGPLGSSTVTSGHSLTTAESDSNVAVVGSDYAKSQNLKVGSKITVAGKAFSVVGIVQPAQAVTAALAPPLTASTGSAAAGPGGPAGRFARPAASAAHTVSVHLSAPVTLGAVALAVLLAVAGGLIAGSLGGWRAVRLRPAAALARVE
jgi:hypothetical protein